MLTALKLTKENLPTIGEVTGVNPESLKLLAQTRDKYVLFETHTLGNDNHRIWPETMFRREFKFTEPESNKFVPIVTVIY
jgi:hypothetical protein